MKYFIRKEADHFTVYSMKKGARQLLVLQKRLYSVDDSLFYRDPTTSEAYVMYDIDCSQPYGHEAVYLDTEKIRVQILSSNISATKNDHTLQLGKIHIEKYLGSIIVVGALLYTFLTGGLHF